MAGTRGNGRAGGRKAAATARPAAPKVVKLTIRVAEDFRWRLRSYAADQRVDVDDLVIRLVEADMAGWYTARRGDAGRPGDAGGEPPARPAGPEAGGEAA